MSKEAAAATLTQIYFDKVNAQVTRRKPTDKIGVEALDEIGQVYGTFLNRLEYYLENASEPPAPPNP